MRLADLEVITYLRNLRVAVTAVFRIVVALAFSLDGAVGAF